MLRLIAFLLLFTTRDPGCSCCLAGYVKVHSGWCLGKGFGGGFTAGCIPATLPHSSQQPILGNSSSLGDHSWASISQGTADIAHLFDGCLLLSACRFS
ncbi:hypothetical protein CCUS01_13821 [Colletotrichum cuscutae]|uniref:Secreted protein n=1 Tax=Colletotrichum cuscutae TaxID=1209917 RepID=A0AAI9YAH2_9PEZI|nr:hypothetical protein CCUS01_13821 [Colletotrichum cuscutae]